MPSPAPDQRKNAFAPRKTALEHAFRDALLEELAVFFDKKMRTCPEFFALETATEMAYRQRISRGVTKREEWLNFSLSQAFKTATRYRYTFEYLKMHAKLAAA